MVMIRMTPQHLLRPAQGRQPGHISGKRSALHCDHTVIVAAAQAAYAHDFMAMKVVGNINIGVVFGLLQFVSTFAITVVYVRWADRHFDPAAEALRERVEQGENL